MMFAAIAVLFALILVQLLLPEFNTLTGKNIVSPLTNPGFWGGLAILIVVTGIISGSYPAFLLSSFKAISVMKSNFRFGHNAGYFRKGLVVLQFVLSMIFIVGMIVVTRQVDYIHNKNLGYQPSNLIYVPITGGMSTNYDAFKHELLSVPGVSSVCMISQRPVLIENSTGSVEWEGKDPNSRPTFTQMAAGYDFIKTMNAEIIQGRDFSEDHADSASYLINETASKVIGYKDPIGMPLTFWNVEGTIIGVVKDFHFNSLHVAIRPIVIRLHQGRGWGYSMIRIEPGKAEQAIAGIEMVHNKFSPEFPFAHQFADEEYGHLYKGEQVVRKLSIYFAVLAICISTLGLLGLIIFAAEQRTKEVGIRKVLGANVTQLVALLSKDFMKLVMFAALFSIPIAYYFMNQWLANFQYHIDIQWWIFALASAASIVVALITVGIQAALAARANPVNSLRSE